MSSVQVPFYPVPQLLTKQLCMLPFEPWAVRDDDLLQRIAFPCGQPVRQAHTRAKHIEEHVARQLVAVGELETLEAREAHAGLSLAERERA